MLLFLIYFLFSHCSVLAAGNQWFLGMVTRKVFLKIPSFFPVLELFIFFDLFLQCFGALTWCCGKCFEFSD